MTRIYRGPVIDPHHHLWDLSLDRHPWLTRRPAEAEEMVYGSPAAIRRNYGIADYRRDATGQTVVATVHVEAGWEDGHPLEESRWLDELDHTTGVAARYVARVPLDAEDAAAMIAAEAENPRVVGIRDIVSWHEEPGKSFARRPGLMSDLAWRAGLAAVGRHGLVFDLMLYPWQMDEAERLVADFPDVQFVLEHAGSPAERSDDGMARWREGLARLSRQRNLAVKITDLVAYDTRWTLSSLSPVICHAIDCFGAERAMFGSDFPAAGLHASFAEIYEVFRKIACQYGENDQRAMFFGTANRIYRLGLATEAGADDFLEE
ncbi:MAG: amidohydrolase family protein [Ancalomicrobiaceae bacterium]|nr:amidohydrolase family protein [Ancalomicrobiaceae bacterium]